MIKNERWLDLFTNPPSTNQKISRKLSVHCFVLITVCAAGLPQSPPCYQPHSYNIPEIRVFSPKNPSSATDRFKLNNDIARIHSIQKHTLHPYVNCYKRIPNSNSFHRLQMTSTSHIDQLPDLVQASTFVGVYAALGLATIPTINMLNSFSTSFVGLERWRNQFIETSLPMLLGALYLTAGIGHFVAMDAFASIYPPIGTWSIWYLPGSANFYVAWTGFVEAFGGFGLLLSGARNALGFVSNEGEGGSEQGLLNLDKLAIPLSSLILFLLTLIVTPANIYMFTHGAMMVDGSPPFGLSFHFARFCVQVILLSLLITLSKDSFFYTWGDELD